MPTATGAEVFPAKAPPELGEYGKPMVWPFYKSKEINALLSWLAMCECNRFRESVYENFDGFGKIRKRIALVC